MATKSDEIDESGFVDLSELENFSFQPKWESSKPSREAFDRPKHGSATKKFSGQKGRFTRPDSKRGSGNFRGERKFGEAGKFGSPSRFSGKNDREGSVEPLDRRRNFGDKNFTKQRFDPIVDIDFYPNDAVFDAIIASLKASYKTYELFTVAKLFLEKQERFAMVIKKKDSQENKDLFLTTDDNFIFGNENDAVAHVLDTHIEKYFDVEEVEVPEPAGNFICLHKCGITGKVLCPPNYHKYQEILIAHHEKYLPRVPFDRFKSRIEKTSAQEEIDSWKSASAKIKVYVPKDQASEEGRIELKAYGDAKRYFEENYKSKAIVQYNSVRVAGETFSKMPRSFLSKSIFVTIEREKTFPLNFSNNLRGRLRRCGFTIYKVGGKSGISYICGIKRKFRTPDDVFEDDIQKIITCIDNNQKISLHSLCAKCVCEEEKPADAEEQKIKDAEGAVRAADSDKNQQFLKNLHWLIREGYVAEFEDGTLVSTEIVSKKNDADTSEETAEAAEEELSVPAEKVVYEESAKETSETA